VNAADDRAGAAWRAAPTTVVPDHTPCSRSTCGSDCVWNTLRTDGNQFSVVVDRDGPRALATIDVLPPGTRPRLIAELAGQHRRDRAVAQHVVAVLLAGPYRHVSVQGTDTASARHDRLWSMMDDELDAALAHHTDDERQLLDSLWVNGDLTYDEAVATARRLLA
jgi:hypothetical protein